MLEGEGPLCKTLGVVPTLGTHNVATTVYRLFVPLEFRMSCEVWVVPWGFAFGAGAGSSDGVGLSAVFLFK